jgi:CheY-like chemotaxis protein
MSDPVRVLVVDDSALMRKLIPQILQADGSIQVVGTAIDGSFALKKIEELKPQVITLDLEMPGMGGMQALREITLRYRLPVIVVSSHTTQGASATFKALAMGALDFVAKPHDASGCAAGPRPRAWSPSASQPADRTPCSTCWHTCLAIFPVPSWWCSTCRKGSPTCLPAAWTNAAPWRSRKRNPATCCRRAAY